MKRVRVFVQAATRGCIPSIAPATAIFCCFYDLCYSTGFIWARQAWPLNLEAMVKVVF
ncbi:MAG TPA: hypothetical protein VIG62_10655 [Blastocatellia bacterium]